MKPKIREKFKHWMKKRISFRLHMSLIMLSTIFLGMISNFILLNTLAIDHPATRYPLSVVLSYGWFFIFIRFYLRNILIESSNGSILDSIDLTPNVSSETVTSSSSVPWSGGGWNIQRRWCLGKLGRH